MAIVWTVSNATLADATLADATLVFLILNSILFSMVGAPAKKNWTLTKAASIPTRRQKARGFLDFFFDAAPHLEYFFLIFRAQH